MRGSCRRPHRTHVTIHGGRDASHARATRSPVATVITASHDHSPLKAPLVPLVATFDALLGVVGSDIGRCLLITAQGHLPASLCWVKHDRLIVGATLGGSTNMLPKRSLCPPCCGLYAWCPGSILVLPWRAWQRTWASSHQHYHRNSLAWDEKSAGSDAASLIVDGIIPGLGLLVLA
jgi:hypothetical protein